jgi:hypothetical protein
LRADYSSRPGSVTPYARLVRDVPVAGDDEEDEDPVVPESNKRNSKKQVCSH